MFQTCNLTLHCLYISISKIISAICNVISKSLFHYINLLLENRFSACGKDFKEKAYFYQVLNIMPKHCLETMCVQRSIISTFVT